jgi:16S rRNA (cytosine1402-N4)-methyltransferase
MIKVIHIPVLLEESLDYLITDRAGIYFEGTLGFGGHTEEILNRLNENAILVSTDVDKTAFDHCKKIFVNESRIRMFNFNYSLIDVIARIESIDFFDGVFLDLGVSSFQIDNTSAGFTYSADAPLDMRMDKNLKLTAYDVINDFDEDKIAKIIYEYGEEKNSRKIARQIVNARGIKKIETTGELKKLISEITPERYQVKTLSRVFQALRIHVNNELEFLKQFLNNSLKVLKKGGRLVLISYHSLEDRIVKEFFKYEQLSCVCPKEVPVCICNKEPQLKIINKKPILPSATEVELNKRARSAKLRIAERI